MTTMRFILLLLAITVISVASYSHANDKFAALVIDGDTGKVLHQEYAGKSRYPASLTKMMTLYLTFRAIEEGRISLNTRMRVSRHAANQPPSKLGLKVGSRIKAKDAIISLIVKSANDSAMVVAENVGGSERRFVQMMNHMAKQLGMHHTSFRNPSGLHDRKQRTTAYDMARLAIALRRDFPQYYHFFKRSKFTYRGRRYVTHNRLTKKYRGAEGMKTGYIRASGYNLVTAAKRNDIRLVGVVLGGQSSKRRDKYMTKMLDKGFYKAEKIRTAKLEKQIIPVPMLRADHIQQEVETPKPVPVETAHKNMFISVRPASELAALIKQSEPEVNRNITRSGSLPKIRPITPQPPASKNASAHPIPRLKPFAPPVKVKLAAVVTAERLKKKAESYLIYNQATKQWIPVPRLREEINPGAD